MADEYHYLTTVVPPSESPSEPPPAVAEAAPAAPAVPAAPAGEAVEVEGRAGSGDFSRQASERDREMAEVAKSGESSADAAPSPGVGPIRFFVPVEAPGPKAREAAPATIPEPVKVPVEEQAGEVDNAAAEYFPVLPATPSPTGAEVRVAVPPDRVDVVEGGGNWISLTALALSVILFALACLVFVKRVKGSARKSQSVRVPDHRPALKVKQAPWSGDVATGDVIVSAPARPERVGLGTTPVLFPSDTRDGSAEKPADEPAAGAGVRPRRRHGDGGDGSSGSTAPFSVKAPSKPKKLF